MAFLYGDFESQPTDQAKLDRLNLHLAEVRQRQGGVSGTSGAGSSVSFDPGYLAQLETRRSELDERVRRFGSNRGPLTYVNTHR